MHLYEGSHLPTLSLLDFLYRVPPVPPPPVLPGNKDPVCTPHRLDESWGGGGGKRNLVCVTAALLADSL